MNNAERTNCCNVFCSTIKKARSNNMVGVYASKDFLENKLNVKNLDNGLQIWVAQYVSDNKISNPGKSSYKGEHQIWQYTSKGKVNGISGNVDLNFGYADYSAKKLKKWIKTSRGWIYGDYKNRWLKQDDRWYWFNQEGIAVTGWQKVKGTDYYFADKEFADQSKGIVKECQCMEPTKD